MLRTLRNWLNIKVILAGILFAVCVFVILVGILWSAKANNSTQVPATALLNIIEVPTVTPPSPMTTATPIPEPTSEQHEPSPSGDISVGDYVQVTGTSGDGLRLHIAAGVSSEVHDVVFDTEVFLVKDGPIDTDGYIWWLLQDPYNENISGWGVSNYLAVVQNP